MEIIVSSDSDRRYPPLYVPMNIVRRTYEIPQESEQELVKMLFENVQYSEEKREFELENSKLEKEIEKII